jgi:hypothetical protein
MIALTKKTAKFSRNKITATAIALLLMLSITGSFVLLPPVNAAITYHTSYIYVEVAPNLVGVGQQVLLVLWPADLPPDIGEQAGLVPGGRAAYYGESFNVTTPDGTTTNYPLGKSDPVGGGYYTYTPTEVGTYTVISIFPETWKNTTTSQIYYSAAVSIPVTFEVQQNPIAPWPESPLPTGYWTRPINNAARLWSALPGNWLGGAWQQPAGAAGGTATRFEYGVGTETSHILWTRPQYVGGYMDARFGDTGYMTGHYQGLDFSAIIINGHIFAPYRADSTQSQGYNVYDLYTGDLMGFYNDTMPSFGQIYNYESPNQHGGYSYLWRTSGVTIANPGGINGTVWEMLDGYTLKSICKIANVTSGGTAVVGKDGSILRYNLVNYGSTANPNYYLQVWNSSAIPSELLGDTGTNAWQWRPGVGGRGLRLGGEYVHDGSKGFSLNVSIPSPLGPRNAIVNQTGTIRAVREDQYVIIGTAGQNDERGDVKGYLMAVSLKRGEEGTKLWDTTFSDPYEPTSANASVSLIAVYPEDNVFICTSTVSLGGSKYLKYWGYDMKTGQQIWVTDTEPQLNYYSQQINYFNGMLLTSGYGGVVIAYNMTTGKQVWNFTATGIGFESPYGNYPINIFAICDGKIYTLAGEHSITQPMWRGPNIRCINATDGTEIWNLLGMGADNGAHLTGQYMQMGDGKVVGLNYFDAEIYCIGPGPSATTVSAPQTVPALGSSVMITGTVTDQTPTGKRNGNYNFDFTLKGTPAISDADMGRWMEYLFEDQIMPADAKGVEVSLDTVDPNGNYVHIGTVTSDINGNYGYAFTPDVPGTYQIIATFAGSKAYGASSSTTYLSVGEAPPATAAPPEYPQPIDYTLAIIGAVVVLLIAIAIVGILLYRKK